MKQQQQYRNLGTGEPNESYMKIFSNLNYSGETAG